tara:strand:+ start:104 stop:295 length:192 start_codon:yes stop_codon:yes gene_type:complete
MSGSCVISSYEKDRGIRTMEDTCDTDDDCIIQKRIKLMPYNKTYLYFKPKLCLRIKEESRAST